MHPSDVQYIMDLVENVSTLSKRVAALESMVAAPSTSANGHEMPSFVEFDDWYKSNACASKRDIYDWFARHFGH